MNQLGKARSHPARPLSPLGVGTAGDHVWQINHIHWGMEGVGADCPAVQGETTTFWVAKKGKGPARLCSLTRGKVRNGLNATGRHRGVRAIVSFRTKFLTGLPAASKIVMLATKPGSFISSCSIAKSSDPSLSGENIFGDNETSVPTRIPSVYCELEYPGVP